MDRKIALILLLLFVSGAALTLAAYLFGVFPFDLRVALRLRDLDNPVFEAVMGAVSLLGDGWVPLVLVLAAAAFCALRKRWIEAAFVVATLSVSILAGVLKALVGRPRPPAFPLSPYDLFPSPGPYAYPSGHVLFFVVFFGFLAWLSWKFLAGRARQVAIFTCGALIVLIGPSRIVLGEHWVSDVIGSYIIGTFWLIILILLYEAVLEGKKRRAEGGIPAGQPA